MEPGTLLPLFARLDFDKVPNEVQPASVLKAHLLTRGIPTPTNVSDDKIRELVHQACGAEKRVLDPSLVPEADSWVGFEPLDEVEIGDEYDDWVSLCCDIDIADCIHRHITITPPLLYYSIE